MSPWNISGASSDVLRIILVIGIREGTLGRSMISQMDSLAKCDDLCNVCEELIIVLLYSFLYDTNLSVIINEKYYSDKGSMIYSCM